MGDADYEIPNDDIVTHSDIQPEADLSGADLSEAYLREADLSGANLSHADLSEAYLREANLSGADLEYADLSGADLPDADLSEAWLTMADLSGARLTEANLSNAWLTKVDLSKAHLTKADLSDVFFSDIILTGAKISRDTKIGDPSRRIRQELADSDVVSEEELQDGIARVDGELRTAYSANGLLSQSRAARVRERRARRKEAKAEGGWGGTAAWAGSLLSRVSTGYGVQFWPVVGWMTLLFVVSTVTYSHVEVRDSISEILMFSVLSFTVAPPTPLPSGTFVQGVVMIETFFGTLSTVLLGYILGNREQV